jgi:CRP-like cAMP-binding protein
MKVHTKNLGGPLDNKLLSSLPRDQFDLLSSHLVTQPLTQGLVLIEAGNEVDYVYFPHYGMLSLLVVLKDGCSFRLGLPKYRPLNSEKQPPQVMQFATSAYNTTKSFYLKHA